MDWKQTTAGVRGGDIEQAFNTISDYISIHDRNFRIVRANDALCKLFHQTEAELIGKTCHSVFHNRGVARSDCPQLRMQQEMVTVPVTEIIDVEHIGQSLLVTCSPVYNGKGEVLGAVHIGRSFTKKQEDVLQVDKTMAEMRKMLVWLKGLGTILTICTSCKNVRNQDGDWDRIEKFMTDTTGVIFNHSMCPRCFGQLFPGAESALTGS